MSAVSIHAPWEGCDDDLGRDAEGEGLFQFTHPGKGATAVPLLASLLLGVSIHAPWEGCDSVVQSCVL